jgi:hypothetical protein
MSNLEIHGARIGDRAVGKPHSGRMQPTGPELGAQARAALWRFYASTRTQGVARDRLGVATVRSQYPATRGLFSDAALAAVLREPESGTCSWDAYRKLATDYGEPPPVPSPDLFGLLGSQCGGCKTHFAAQVVAERERPHVAAVVAAGFRPSTAGHVRTAEQLARHQDALRAAARRPPAPTGMLWSADQGEPPGLTAAAYAAANRSRRAGRY